MGEISQREPEPCVPLEVAATWRVEVRSPERSSRAAHAAHTERTIEELTVMGGLMSLRLLRQNAVGTRLESTAARRFAGRSLDVWASGGSQVGSAGSVVTRGG